MTRCRGCGEDAAHAIIDLGPQPLCNRFLTRPDEREYLHPMVVGRCASCGLVQLVGDLVPPEEMRPRVDWITYREPEAHLDGVAAEIALLPDLPRAPAVVGISFKDDPLLVRLRDRLGARIHRLDQLADLGIVEPGAGVETIQRRFELATARRIAQKRGRADLVIARHILEHAHDPRAFVGALFELARPGGYVLLEAPDCTRGLDHGDASTLWEEHSLYLTPGTFTSMVAAWGLEPVISRRIPNEPEGLVLAVTRQSTFGAARPVVDRADLERGLVFASAFDRSRSAAEARLRAHGRIALFGAGHLGCTFVDLLRLGEAVEFFVDDHPQKRGLFMPGSHLPIRSSADLVSAGISLCLLSLAPESEPSVLARNSAFLGAGGRFASIFPGIERSAGSDVAPFETILGTP